MTISFLILKYIDDAFQAYISAYYQFMYTLRTETFAGRNFRVFRVFGPFSRKFMPLEISKQQNAKVFSREIIDNFKNAKVFSREKKLSFQANLRPLPEIRCSRKNQRHMDGYY